MPSPLLIIYLFSLTVMPHLSFWEDIPTSLQNRVPVVVVLVRQYVTTTRALSAVCSRKAFSECAVDGASLLPWQLHAPSWFPLQTCTAHRASSSSRTRQSHLPEPNAELTGHHLHPAQSPRGTVAARLQQWPGKSDLQTDLSRKKQVVNSQLTMQRKGYGTLTLLSASCQSCYCPQLQKY